MATVFAKLKTSIAKQVLYLKLLFLYDFRRELKKKKQWQSASQSDLVTSDSRYGELRTAAGLTLMMACSLFSCHVKKKGWE